MVRSRGPSSRTEESDAVTVTIASRGRPGKARNEDIAFFVDDLACVLDGASLPRETSCGHDSAWYVRVFARHLVAAYLQDSSAGLADIVREAIRRSAREHWESCERSGDPMRAAATVVLTRRRGSVLDYLVLCDSALLIDGAQGVQVVTDERIAALPLRAGIRIHEMLAAGRGYGAEYEQLVRELVLELDPHRNVEGGYWIASDDPGAADRALLGTAPLSDVALVTDGVTRAVTALGVYGCWGELLHALRDAGPESVIEAVRRAEHQDPHGRSHPRGSPYDDATALVWQP